MRLQRKNKVMVALTADKDARDRLLQEMLVDAGFCKITSDARKIISKSIYDIDVDTAFFVAAADFRFNENHVVSQRLIRMALVGIPVFISTKHVPNQYQPFCEIIFPR